MFTEREVKMNWIIIAALIVLAFAFLRLRHVKHKVFLISFIIILLFLYTTASQVLSNYDIDWKSFSGVEKGAKVYFSWLGGFFDNLKILTANAVKMDWTQKNRTESVRIEEK